jgi:NADH-quinone oxidoreductase subunit J
MSMWILIFGVFTVIAAGGVVFSRKSLHSALWLVVTLVLVAVHFALLGAEFLAALQMLIYAGAIMVLMVFVIMLLGAEQEVEWGNTKVPAYAGAVFCGAFCGIVFVLGTGITSLPLAKPMPGAVLSGTAAVLGRLLFSEHVYAFELMGVLLFAAIVGAVVLAKEKKRPLAPGRGLRAVREREMEPEELKSSGS